MKKPNPEKAIVIACIVIALGIWYITHITGCDCIKVNHIIPILATGFAIGILVTSIRQWLIKRENEKKR